MTIFEIFIEVKNLLLVKSQHVTVILAAWPNKYDKSLKPSTICRGATFELFLLSCWLYHKSI